MFLWPRTSVCMVFFQFVSTIGSLGCAIEVILKLRGSGHLRVALKHLQSLRLSLSTSLTLAAMRELVHVQGGQMPDIGLYACKIEVLSLSWFMIFCLMHSCAFFL